MKQFDADSPGRLDVVLAEHVGSRAKAARLIEAGLVTVDGSARSKSFAVARGILRVLVPGQLEFVQSAAELVAVRLRERWDHANQKDDEGGDAHG